MLNSSPVHTSFDADMLSCVFALTGKATPTRAKFSAVLHELYPTGPTVDMLLASGLVVPTIDKQGLRETPLSLAEQDRRLNAPVASPLVETVSPPAIMPPLFSYYRGGICATAPYATISPAQLYAVLTSSRSRATTEAIRAAPASSPQRAELKKRLDYVTPAGIFTQRANDGLVTTSGMIVLDFDHLANVQAARAALLADRFMRPELVLLFTSPSGDGLKAFIRTDPAESHLDNFQSCANYLSGHYAELGLVPDKAGKDVARACFVPYAPDAWLAPAYACAA